MKIKHNSLYCDDDFWKSLQPYRDSTKKGFVHILQSLQDNAPGYGWFSWPQKYGFELLERIQQEISSDVKEFYDCVVVVGIGGSYLGTAAIYDVFSSLETQGYITL